MSIQDLRDILLSVYLGLGILLSLILILGIILMLKALLGLIKAAKRPLDNIGEASESLIGRVVDTEKDGSSFGSVTGSVISFGIGILGSVIKGFFKKKPAKRKKKRS